MAIDGKDTPYLPGRLDTVHVRHINIHEDKLVVEAQGQCTLHNVHCLRAIMSKIDASEVALAHLKQAFETQEAHWLVVNEKYARTAFAPLLNLIHHIW